MSRTIDPSFLRAIVEESNAAVETAAANTQGERVARMRATAADLRAIRDGKLVMAAGMRVPLEAAERKLRRTFFVVRKAFLAEQAARKSAGEQLSLALQQDSERAS